MCEILLCVKTRTTGDATFDSRFPKRGDVVAVAADGWAWSECELGHVVAGNPNGNHNFFRVIKLPNVTALQASNMLTPERDIDPQNPSPFLQYRARFLDAAKIPAATMQALIDYWNDDGRAQGFISLPYTAAQIATIATTTDDAACPAYHKRIAFP